MNPALLVGSDDGVLQGVLLAFVRDVSGAVRVIVVQAGEGDAHVGRHAWADRLRGVDVPLYAYFRHEDEPTAPAYALRLLELLGQ